MIMRASFNSADPTLRLTLRVAGISHHQVGYAGFHHQHSLWHGDDHLGVYTAEQLWKVITERKPGQTILAVLKDAGPQVEAA
jgi:hypothetical protein